MPGSSIDIVKLNSNEWPIYKQLRLEALQNEPQSFSTTYADMLTRSDEFWVGRVKAAEAESEDWLLLLAKYEDRYIGLLGAYCEKGWGMDDTAHIVQVYVNKAYRGLGAGKKLLEAMIAKLKRIPNLTVVRLSVNSIQTAAVRLYESCGFKAIGQEESLSGDGKMYTEILYQRLLRDE